jgi:myo-inositol-1(or 4)-monophosphatase
MMDFALRIAEKAGVIALKHFRRTNRVSFKSRQDIVTTADTEVEKFITKEIGKQFPQHGILAEESGRHKGSSDYLWVIDPIDGTVNFAAGFPYFAISIGLAYREHPILGVVYDPYHNEFIYAEKGRGAYLNRKRIRIGRERDLINCIVATDLGHKRSKRIVRRIKALLPATRAVRILGSASRGLVDVAVGRAQAYVHNDIQPWDVAAAYIVIKEAGGDVLNFKGQPWQLYDGTVIASNNILSKKLLRYVQ